MMSSSCQKIQETFDGMPVTFHTIEKQQKAPQYVIYGETRFFELSFENKDIFKVLSVYLPDVLQEAKRIKQIRNMNHQRPLMFTDLEIERSLRKKENIASSYDGEDQGCYEKWLFLSSFYGSQVLVGMDAQAQQGILAAVGLIWLALCNMGPGPYALKGSGTNLASR
ncbi:hypothetical protein ACLOJK_033808 [Asimina triloba]